MIAAVGVGKGVEGVIGVHTECFGGNEHRAGGTEADIAAACADRAGAYRRCGVVSGAGNHNGVRRDAQQGGDLRLYGANFFVAFIEPGHLLLRNAADVQHLFGPALVLHIEQQHAGSVGIIAAVGPCEHIVHIILRQHDLCDFPEVLRLVLPKPQDFRGGEARKGNVGGPLGQLFFADDVVQVVHLVAGPAIIPENRRADDPVLGIQHHQPVHLPAAADAGHGGGIKAPQQFRDAGKHCPFPVLRVLLAPAGLRKFQGIFLRDRIQNGTVLAYQQQLRRRGPQVDTDVCIFHVLLLFTYPS